MILKNGIVLGGDFVFEKRDVCINEGLIAENGGGTEIDCGGMYVLPGLVDIHTHGAAGYDNMDESYEAINGISRFMAQNGVTTYLPTVLTHSREKLLAAVKNIKEAKNKGVSGAKIGGIYMEGPYFSAKYKGAQNEKYLRDPSIDEFNEINEASGGLIRIVSLAPERRGALEFIEAEKGNVRLALGHTDADYDEAMAAIKSGASCITHIFNAMRRMEHRAPNVVGAAFDSDVMCECICDGFHIAPPIIRLLFKAVGEDRVVFISDSLRAAGMSDGKYELGGQTFLLKNGEARLRDGTIAGSIAKLSECVKKAIEFGITPEAAIKAAAINPARTAGIDDVCGSIEAGKSADLVIADKDFSPRRVFVNGEEIAKCI